MSPLAHPLSGRLRVPGSDARYEILGKLATGGMAELFLARAPQPSGAPGPVVVLKRILPHLAEDEDFVRMFRDEAHLAFALQHPNIVRTLDIGPADEHFFTMEYVHGDDLRAIFDAAEASGQNVPLPHVLSIALGLTAALHYTHEHTDDAGRPLHIVHRDVSPTNVLVGFDGVVKLVDFGVAKAEAGTHVTRAGTLKGKLAYMSPEQCRADVVDRRSDVFSVGILLYEMTTLRRLFAGETDIAVLHNVMKGVRTPPSTLRRGYPPDLERIVLAALQSDPNRRYPTAGALHDDLERFAATLGVRTDPQALARYLRGLFGERPLPWEDPSRTEFIRTGPPSTPAPPVGSVAPAEDPQPTLRFGSGPAQPQGTLVGHPGSASSRAGADKTAVASSSATVAGPVPPFTAQSQTIMVSPAPRPARPLWPFITLFAGLAVGVAMYVYWPADPPKSAPTVWAGAAQQDVPPPADPIPPQPDVPAVDAPIEVPAEFTKPPEFAQPAPQDAPLFSLRRVEGEGRDRVAVLTLRDGTTERVKLGETVQGHRVVAVNEASVLLEASVQGRTQTTRLEL
ncbi:MAG: serine/threonine protein kinase [Nannocystaceae bacterium]|nr:protein kinase [bacterium]